MGDLQELLRGHIVVDHGCEAGDINLSLALLQEEMGVQNRTFLEIFNDNLFAIKCL